MPTLHRPTALIVVDVQKDFCEGGALAVEGGNDLAERIGQFMRAEHARYDLVVVTQDWHRSFEQDPSGNCGHFAPDDEPDYQNTWPVHCVFGTDGAYLHDEIRAAMRAMDNQDGREAWILRKGQGVPGYSAFDGSFTHTYTPGGAHVTDRFGGASLRAVLDALQIYRVEICGLVYEHCVWKTAHDASLLAYHTAILRDLTIPADKQQGDYLDGEHHRHYIELVRS